MRYCRPGLEPCSILCPCRMLNRRRGKQASASKGLSGVVKGAQAGVLKGAKAKRQQAANKRARR